MTEFDDQSNSQLDAKTEKTLIDIVRKLNFKSTYSDMGVHAGEWRVSFSDVHLTSEELSLLQDLRYEETK